MVCVRWLAPALSCVALLGCARNNPAASGGSDPPPELTEGSTGYAIVDIPGVGPQRVEYVVTNGQATYGGDITLSPEQISGLADPRTTSAGRQQQSHRWPNGVIPYLKDTVTIAPGTPIDTTVNNAMVAWSTQTPIRFTPYSGSGDYMYFFAPPSNPNNKPNGPGWGGLSSSVGLMAGSGNPPGRHTIRLATDIGCCNTGCSPCGNACCGPTGMAGDPACATCIGVPTHEIGHIIGLYHEHQRADRDTFLKVYDGMSPVGCTPGVNCYPDNFSCANGSACTFDNVTMTNKCSNGACCVPGRGDYQRYSTLAVGNYGNDGVDLAPGLDMKSIMMYVGSTTGCCGKRCMTDLNDLGFSGGGQIPTGQDLAGVEQLYFSVLVPWVYGYLGSSILR